MKNEMVPFKGVQKRQSAEWDFEDKEMMNAAETLQNIIARSETVRKNAEKILKALEDLKHLGMDTEFQINSSREGFQGISYMLSRAELDLTLMPGQMQQALSLLEELTGINELRKTKKT